MPKTKKNYKNLEKYRQYCNRNRKACYHRGNFRENGNRHEYTLEEVNEILEHIVSDRELAEKYKCSVQSIQVKRCRLKKSMEHLKEQTNEEKE